MNIAPIPTTYNGVQFRSRLEARWAVFFDLMGWEWEYEPIDLNGWIPDFVIKGNIDLLVEVKYFSVYSEYPSIDEKWLAQLTKIEQANPDKPVLLLSGNPYQEGNGYPYVGFLFEMLETNESLVEYHKMYSEEEIVCGMHIALGTSKHLIQDPPFIEVKPEYASKNYVNVAIETISEEYLKEKWKVAGNEVQWKKPK